MSSSIKSISWSISGLQDGISILNSLPALTLKPNKESIFFISDDEIAKPMIFSEQVTNLMHNLWK